MQLFKCCIRFWTREWATVWPRSGVRQCRAGSGKDDNQIFSTLLKNEKRVIFNSNTDIFTWPLFRVIVRSSETKARIVVLQKFSNYYCLALGERQLMEAGMVDVGVGVWPRMCELDQHTVDQHSSQWKKLWFISWQTEREVGGSLYINLRWISWKSNFFVVSRHNPEIFQTLNFLLSFCLSTKMLFMNKREFSSLIDCFVWIESKGVVWFSVRVFLLSRLLSKVSKEIM